MASGRHFSRMRLGAANVPARRCRSPGPRPPAMLGTSPVRRTRMHVPDVAGMTRRAWWLVPLLAPWLVLWPLCGAGFTGDDWSFLALSRHGDGPLGFFLHDHSFTYLYRPVAMSLWWGSTALFGAEPAGHYVVNLLLHGGNAALVALLVRAGGGGRALALGIAVLFALHPVGAAT